MMREISLLERIDPDDHRTLWKWYFDELIRLVRHKKNFLAVLQMISYVEKPNWNGR